MARARPRHPPADMRCSCEGRVRTTLTINEARAELRPAFAPRPARKIPLADALGLYRAGDLAATPALPPFDISAMAGYAVRAAELGSPPVRLPVRGESRAGGEMPPPLE